jgi:hypothetical protein
MSACSFAFKLRRGEAGLSLDLEYLTTHEVSVVDTESFCLYALEAKHPFEKGLQCVHDPLEDNFAHTEIRGNITNGAASYLAKNSIYVYPPLANQAASAKADD